MRKWIAICFVTFAISVLFNPVVAQAVSDAEIANHYYQNQEFSKALPYYDKLYTGNTKNKFYFERFLDCLTKTDNHKEAERLVKRSIKQDPRDLSLYINLADVYKSLNDEASAEKAYQDAIKNISKNIPYNFISTLANDFTRIAKYNYALEVYDKAQKLFPDKPEFQFRKAYVQGLNGDFELMINSYLDLAVQFPNYLQTAQNQLAQQLGFESDTPKNTELLRVALLKRIQKDPNEIVYNEILVWYFIQMKDFDAAFIQVKAWDKKIKADGYKVLEFGRICYNNNYYSNAIDAYNYVMGLGEKTNYYKAAKIERLKALNQKITTTSNYTKADLLTLKADFVSTINYIGKSSVSMPLRIDLAKLMTFYLHQPDSARVILEEALTIPGTSNYDIAECKMNLADVLVFQDNIWDASLYYAQVEKDFKEDPIGHEAKFRKAKIFYYDGEFDLAQAQLDVLKTSTTKLIANDAFELSLLITDNFNMDTTTINMENYAKAHLLIYQNRFEEAKKYLDKITSSVAYHPLNDEVLYKRYEMAYKQQKYTEAASFLMDIVANYSKDILADNALFKLGELYEYQLNDKTKAAEYYKQLMFNYTGSLFTVEARKRYRNLTSKEEKFFNGIE